MLRKIEELRTKPKHVRNRYAFWVATLVTLIIALVWASTLPARYDGSILTNQAEDEDDGGFVTDVLQEAKDSVANVRDSISPGENEESVDAAPQETPEELTELLEQFDLSDVQHNAP